MQEKNRINTSLNKSHEGSNNYPTIKLTASGNDVKRERQKGEKQTHSNFSPLTGNKKFNSTERQVSPGSTGSPQSKLQKFGIKVLPMPLSPKTGDSKEKPRSPIVFENELNVGNNKNDKLINHKPPSAPSRSTSPSGDSLKNRQNGLDESDGSRENVKAMLAKGFQNLKDKINQNTLGKKKNKDPVIPDRANSPEPSHEIKDIKDMDNKNKVLPTLKNNFKISTEITSDAEHPVPKLRGSANNRLKESEKTIKNEFSVPEEVARAGDVARNNRKSLNDPNSGRKSVTSLISEPDSENQSIENLSHKNENFSDGEVSFDGDTSKTLEEAKRPKRSKGKAPAPPDPVKEEKSNSPKKTKCFDSNEINEIKKDTDLDVVKNDKRNSFDSIKPDAKVATLRDKNEVEKELHRPPTYDSDSDTEPKNNDGEDKPNNTKIELNANQVTVHQSPSGDVNDDDIKPGRKAASLGDLSKLDSDQPLSIVLERAVSLDLADGVVQAGKKRKAPLPPSEEFTAAFDDLSYRAEPQVENSLGLNTFQRRLKKSSDFGTLEDVLNEGPKSLEIEINNHSSPVDLAETHNSNIQEFSSWLAECRRPKSNNSETSEEQSPSRKSTTSLINISSPEELNKENKKGDKTEFEFQNNNVSFSVNGKNFPDFEIKEEKSTVTSGTNSKTVVVISQPNSLERTFAETVPLNPAKDDEKQNYFSLENEINSQSLPYQATESSTFDTFITASSDSRMENYTKPSENEDEPPKLPTSPMPEMTNSSTLSTPLSSSLTYITEIKVSTSLKDGNKNRSSSTDGTMSPTLSYRSQIDQFGLDTSELKTSTPRPHSLSFIDKKIQQFDSKPTLAKPLISPIKTKPQLGSLESNNDSVFESSKIPIKTMKSETGQKVLATIQSLAAKGATPSKSPEIEYAKRVASLFSGNSLERNKGEQHRHKPDLIKNEENHLNNSGFFLKEPPQTSPTKPSKDFVPTRKVPPMVPPRKMETTLSSKTITVDIVPKNKDVVNSSQIPIRDRVIPNDDQERNIVTFSSFMPKTQNEESSNSSLISFKIK